MKSSHGATRGKSNHKRILKPSERRAIIKTLSPCYGTFKCSTFNKGYDTEFKSPADCPASIECIEKFTIDYMAEEMGINSDLVKATKRLRKLLAKNLKRIYLSHAHKGKTPTSEVRGK